MLEMLRRKPICPLGVTAVALGGVLCLASLSPADMFQYVDSRGVVHLTNMRKGPAYRLALKEKRRRIGPLRMNRVRVEGYRDIIHRIAAQHRVDPKLVAAVVRAESDFDPRAVSRKGAMGLMQLMPETAARFRLSNPFDPEQNLDAGVQHLKRLLGLFDGNVPLSLAAYNAGENAVIRYGDVPPYRETRGYVRKVLMFYRGRNAIRILPRPTYRVELSDGTVLFTDSIPAQGVNQLNRLR